MLTIKKKKIISALSSVLFVFYANDYLVVATSQSHASAAFHSGDLRLMLSNNGKSTIKNLITNGFNLIGRVNYIWGGGRNVVNGKYIVDTIGIPLDWEKFSASHDYSKEYNWRKCLDSKKPCDIDYSDLHNGLDCSGFVAWLVKNTVKDSKGLSFLRRAMNMAKFYGEGADNLGLGKYSDFGQIKNIWPGDIVSMNRSWNREEKLESESHVYLSLGQFDDGSILLLDMSGEGTIMIRGTRSRNAIVKENVNDLSSEAIDTANYCMKTYYPDTYRDWKLEENRKYICIKDDYRLDSSMHWNTTGPDSVISDPEGYHCKSPYDVLSDLFGEKINRKVVLSYLNKNSIKLNHKRKPHRHRANMISGKNLN